jgi:uncharacterized protein (DUF952 family)
MTDNIAYKVLTADEWAALSADAFRGAPIDVADGFIHLSTASQLTETVDRHFSGQKGLVMRERYGATAGVSGALHADRIA